MTVQRMMNWGSVPVLFLFLTGASGLHCGASQAQARATASGHAAMEAKAASVEPAVATKAVGVDDQDTGRWNRPFFGFNAKGTLDVPTQTKFANAFFDKITSPNIKKNLVVRVTAGTYSQLTYMKDWSDEMIKMWVDLQKKQGIRYIYVVNGNDTPANQAQVIQRWLDAGAHFDLIEMMNEYYLPKYAKGDLSKPEVKEKITPEKYVNEILPAFWKELDRFNLPYYLIFAPTRPGRAGADKIMSHWNDVLTDAVKNKYPDRQLNATLHLYVLEKANADDFDYDQIDQVRKDLPAGRHIAITEAGVVDPSLSYQEAGQISVAHYRNILKHLQPGDYLLDQILYNAGKKNNTAALNPQSNGETMKGKAILQFIQTKLE